MSKHLPGPWRYEICTAEMNARVIAWGGNHVAMVWSGKQPSLEVVEANAKLIAAAPKLLEYLTGIVQAIERGELMICDMNSKPQRGATAYLLEEARVLISGVES